MSETAGQTTFTEEPEHVLKTLADDQTYVLVWKLQYRNDRCNPPGISIKTNNFQLYPDPEDPTLPTMLNSDYNVTVQESTIDECRNEDNMLEINVTLRITLNTRVFMHVPYVVCIVGDDRSRKVCLSSGYEGCTELKLSAMTLEETPSTTVKGLDLTTYGHNSSVSNCAACWPNPVLHLCAFIFITFFFCYYSNGVTKL